MDGVRQVIDVHYERRRLLLQSHPELRKLEGATLKTCIPSASIWIVHCGIAFALRGQPWWLVGAAAYTIGAVLALGIWVLLHDCAHDLVFRKPRPNKWMGILIALPLVIPAASTFRKFHLLHHKYPGDAVLDGDVPSRWEVKLVGKSVLGKALWLAFFPLLQSLRPMRMPSVAVVDKWSLTNLAAQLVFNLLAYWFFGIEGLVYLLFANFFALGISPLGARWVQEHFPLVPGQKTFSYYGPLNKIVFNAGYHVEHHDMMRIPWMRLPLLRQSAPEFYQDLHSYRSWAALFFRFLFDRRIGLDRGES